MRPLTALFLPTVLLLASAVAAAVPSTMTFQGRLTDDLGQPLDTTVALTFRLYVASSGGSPVWVETHDDVVISYGVFEVQLGETSPLTRSHFDGSPRWLSIAVDGGAESAVRLPVNSSAYTIRANYADTSGRAKYADTAAFAVGVGNSGWADDGANVRLVTASDWLGIGTASPEDKVHIESSLSGGTAFLKLETSHASNWGETGLRIETPQNRWHLRMDDATNNNIPDGALGLRSQDVGTEIMTWTSDGKVGILNTLPEYPLDVRSTAVAIYGRTTGGLGTAGVYGRAENDGFGVMGTSTSGRGVYGASASGFGGYFLGPTTYVSGNLGVGTETPTHKLTLNGTLAYQSAGTTKYHVAYYGGGLDFCETGVGDYRLMIEDGGEVGIGTANPTAKLHVMGNVKVRDTLTAGAIFSSSIVDEFGLASAKNALYESTACTGSWKSCLSRTIRVPAPGWVLAVATARVKLDHPGSGSTDVSVALSDDSTTADDWWYANWALPGAAVAGNYYSTLNPMRLFRTDTAGVYTFYVNARRLDGEASVLGAQMHCFFIATSYSFDKAVAGGEGSGAQPAAPVLTELGDVPAPAENPGAADVASILAELSALRQEVESLRNKVEANR